MSAVPSTRLTPPTHSPLSKWSSLFQVMRCTSGHLGGLLTAASLSLGTGCLMQGRERMLSTGLWPHGHGLEGHLDLPSPISRAEISLWGSQGHFQLIQPSSFIHSFTH